MGMGRFCYEKNIIGGYAFLYAVVDNCYAFA